MKKAALIKSLCFVFVSLSCCFFLLGSCGLESYYFLEPPYEGNNVPDGNNSDKPLMYFSFVTQESENAEYINGSEFKFKGTEIYYKIFNNYNEMVNWQNEIDRLNSGTNYTAAFEKLTSSSYNYQKLNLSCDVVLDPLIAATGDNRYVYIRLNDYGTEESFRNGICIGNDSLSEYDEASAMKVKGEIVYPRRTDGASVKHGFNFCPSDGADDDNPVPSENDIDVQYNSTPTNEGTWYVDMYAVSVGVDNSFNYSYSKVLHLGSIFIEESDYKD